MITVGNPATAATARTEANAINYGKQGRIDDPTRHPNNQFTGL